jgi:hypothetical protein
MEGGSLFNPGFLGANFNWWIGQIADDSTWRDNIVPGKFENGNAIPGWGYRYKVRIIGLHDQGEIAVPSDQLPWAQVMFPITAGGGQTSATQTPNLRQGMMVFGFFLDEKDQQVPVIMGILGNNEQTPLATTIGTNRVTNETPGSLATSGYAQGQSPPPGTSLPKTPDSNLAINPSTGPTIEGINAVHLLSNADVKRNELYNVKVFMADPNDLVGSAMKGIQVEVENLTRKIDKNAHAVGSYVDAISAVAARSGCLSAIAGSAQKIASYLKIIYYNLFSCLMKEINKLLSPTVDLLFPNDRFKFLDIKDILTEITNCLFKQIINELISLVTSYLTNLINCSQVIPSPDGTAPFAPICTAETLAGEILASNQEKIQNELNKALGVVNGFLEDISEGLGDIAQISQIAGIALNVAFCLNFENLTLKFFPCDLLPNKPISDFYTLQSGGGGITEQFLPNLVNVAQSVTSSINIPATERVPFVQPRRTEPIDYSDRRTSPEETQSRTIA